jgi:hypothetical protein
MPNALNPDLMTPAERLAEVGQILAAGVMRRNAMKSSGLSAETGDCFVDLPRRKSGSGDGKTFRIGGNHHED